ncbi:MAG TPA: hypothetical protein VIE47_04185 [Methylocystis sp.]
MSALIISTLRDKRLEVADAIERLERQADQHRADLAHLEATMRLFNPNVEPETFQPTPPRRRNDWFRPGECRRRIHDVLRDAAGPMTREIVEGVMAAKKLPDDDARTCELIHKTVLGSLNRATDTIERVEAAGSVAWRVIDAAAAHCQ